MEKHYICTVKKNRIHITANERRGALYFMAIKD